MYRYLGQHPTYPSSCVNTQHIHTYHYICTCIQYIHTCISFNQYECSLHITICTVCLLLMRGTCQWSIQCVPILVLNELLAKGLAMNRITKPLCTYLPTYPLTPHRVHTVGPLPCSLSQSGNLCNEEVSQNNVSPLSSSCCLHTYVPVFNLERTYTTV